MMTWRPGRKSATLATLATFWLTVCRNLHEGAEACTFHGVEEAPKMNLLVSISIPMIHWRPGRESLTWELATFWVTVCRSLCLRVGVEACSGLGLHEVHAALEMISYLAKLMKTFWTKTNPPPSEKAVSWRRLDEVGWLRPGKIS